MFYTFYYYCSSSNNISTINDYNYISKLTHNGVVAM